MSVSLLCFFFLSFFLTTFQTPEHNKLNFYFHRKHNPNFLCVTLFSVFLVFSFDLLFDFLSHLFLCDSCCCISPRPSLFCCACEKVSLCGVPHQKAVPETADDFCDDLVRHACPIVCCSVEFPIPIPIPFKSIQIHSNLSFWSARVRFRGFLRSAELSDLFFFFFLRIHSNTLKDAQIRSKMPKSVFSERNDSFCRVLALRREEKVSERFFFFFKSKIHSNLKSSAPRSSSRSTAVFFFFSSNPFKGVQIHSNPFKSVQSPTVTRLAAPAVGRSPS